MPASISEAFDSPYNVIKEEDPTPIIPEKKTDLDYNSVLSPFFPKSTVENAPYSIQQQYNVPSIKSNVQEESKVVTDQPEQLSGRDLLPLYTGPSAHPMRNGGHDCHEQIASIASILSCRVCREKLKLLLNDESFQSGGGSGSNVVSSLASSISTLSQNTDFVNLFLIIGMALIIHKLFRK
jgi:hypothetical protein